MKYIMVVLLVAALTVFGYAANSTAQTENCTCAPCECGECTC